MRTPALHPQMANVIALQRAVGNTVVSRYMPVPPGTPAPVAHALNKTPLEDVMSLLEYGVLDWAITDEDAAKATRILGDMNDADLTKAVAQLDGSQTPYLDRLVDNANLAVVRSPAFAKIMSKRAPARNAALAKRLMSYGIFDWEITPPEAEATQTLIDSLPPAESDRVSEEWIHHRIKENLASEGDYEKGVGEPLLDDAVQRFQRRPDVLKYRGHLALGLSPSPSGRRRPAT